MFRNSTTFSRIVIHTIGVLFLIGVVGSTALGDEDILSSIVEAIFVATFGSSSTSDPSGGTSPSSSSPLEQPMSGEPSPNPPPPDSLN